MQLQIKKMVNGRVVLVDHNGHREYVAKNIQAFYKQLAQGKTYFLNHHDITVEAYLYINNLLDDIHQQDIVAISVILSSELAHYGIYIDNAFGRKLMQPIKYH